MDDQSFRLLMSKLDSIEDSHRAMAIQVDDRLRQHFDLFQQHTEEDRKLAQAQGAAVVAKDMASANAAQAQAAVPSSRLWKR